MPISHRVWLRKWDRALATTVVATRAFTGLVGMGQPQDAEQVRYTEDSSNAVREGATVAVTVSEIWDEIDEFLTSTPTPKQILAFRPSQAAQERLRGLLEASERGPLSAQEVAALNEALAVEQFMRRLKIKALAKAQG